MSVNGTLTEDKMRRFKGECEHFSCNKCPIYAHDGASAKFSTNSHKTDNSAGGPKHTDPDLDFQQLVNRPLRKEEAFFLTFTSFFGRLKIIKKSQNRMNEDFFLTSCA